MVQAAGTLVMFRQLVPLLCLGSWYPCYVLGSWYPGTICEIGAGSTGHHFLTNILNISEGSTSGVEI